MTSAKNAILLKCKKLSLTSLGTLTNDTLNFLNALNASCNQQGGPSGISYEVVYLGPSKVLERYH